MSLKSLSKEEIYGTVKNYVEKPTPGLSQLRVSECDPRSDYLKSVYYKNGGKIFFREFNKYGITGYYLFDYISNYNIEHFPNPIFSLVKKNVIYSFKDGHYTNHIKSLIVCSLLNLDVTILDNPEICLCVIPASTKINTDLRFKKLCLELSQILNIQNGFNFISRQTDRLTSNDLGKGNFDILEGLTFHPELKNRKVLLLDDIVTKGTSIREFHKQLVKIGCAQVLPFFIGKTFYYDDSHCREKDLLDYNYNNYQFSDDLHFISSSGKISPAIESLTEKFRYLNPSQITTLSILQTGKSITECAQLRGMTRSTIVSHVWESKMKHNEINIPHIKPDNEILADVYFAYFQTNFPAHKSLKILFEFLQESVAYDDIRLSLSFIKSYYPQA